MTDTRKAGQRTGKRQPQRTTTEGQRRLTDRQELFCREYIVDLNATQAAIRAGYSEKGADVTASKMLGDARIRTRIDELQQSRSVRTRITQDYVLENLEEILERCMQRAPVMVKVDGEWEQLQDEQGRDVWQFDAKNALGAIKQMGDHLGLYTQKVQVSGPNGGPVKTENANTNVDLKPEDLEGLSVGELIQRYFQK